MFGIGRLINRPQSREILRQGLQLEQRQEEEEQQEEEERQQEEEMRERLEVSVGNMILGMSSINPHCQMDFVFPLSLQEEGNCSSIIHLPSPLELLQEEQQREESDEEKDEQDFEIWRRGGEKE
jgi:hypothetical protein